MAILVLRWKYGYTAVKWLADVIQAFIEFGFVGEAAVFGDPFLIFHPFAFMVKCFTLSSDRLIRKCV